MTLQNSTESRIPEPSSEVLAAIRRSVQQACAHDELRIVAAAEHRCECLNCGLTR